MGTDHPTPPARPIGRVATVSLVVVAVVVATMAFLLASRPTSSATNLLANPGFEVDANADGSPDGWTKHARFSRVAAPVHGGSFAGRFLATADAAGSVQQEVSVTAGTTHDFSAWVQAPSTSDRFTFQFKVQWRSGGTLLNTVVVKRFTDDTAGAWQPVTGTLTAPAGSTRARLIMAVSSLSSAVHVDDVLLSPVDPPTPTPVPTPSPTPPPGSGTSAVLVGAGDIANCSRAEDEATAALLDSLAGTVFTAGDNAYPDGSATNFSACFEPTWGRHRDRIRPAPGNHDYHTSAAASYFEYFGAQAGPSGLGYYAYDHGDWRIYALNSEVVSAEQVQWLQQDLAANPRACVAAYWHHPRFATGYAGGSHDDNTFTAPLWDALATAGAELIINGHSHHYERFAPKQGMLEVIVGTGGTGLKAFASPVAEGSEVRNATDHGVLRVTLEPGGYAAQFIPIAGRSFTDAFSGSCQ